MVMVPKFRGRLPQSVDPQQHAVKIAQFGPADIARQQTQPSSVIMDKRAAQQLLLARRQQGQDIPGAEEASRFKWLS